MEVESRESFNCGWSVRLSGWVPTAAGLFLSPKAPRDYDSQIQFSGGSQFATLIDHTSFSLLSCHHLVLQTTVRAYELVLFRHLTTFFSGIKGKNVSPPTPNDSRRYIVLSIRQWSDTLFQMMCSVNEFLFQASKRGTFTKQLSIITRWRHVSSASVLYVNLDADVTQFQRKFSEKQRCVTTFKSNQLVYLPQTSVRWNAVDDDNGI